MNRDHKCSKCGGQMAWQENILQCSSCGHSVQPGRPLYECACVHCRDENAGAVGQLIIGGGSEELKERICSLIKENPEMFDCDMPKVLGVADPNDFWAALHELEREGRIIPRPAFGPGPQRLDDTDTPGHLILS